MKTKKKPELGAVIIMYVLMMGMFTLFGSSAYFYLVKSETEGTVISTNADIVEVSYFDKTGANYIATVQEQPEKRSFNIGDKAIVYYIEKNPSRVHLPDFDGYEPYFLYYIFLIMAFTAAVDTHRKYLKE
jgi:hypothetical protein